MSCMQHEIEDWCIYQHTIRYNSESKMEMGTNPGLHAMRTGEKSGNQPYAKVAIGCFSAAGPNDITIEYIGSPLDTRPTLCGFTSSANRIDGGCSILTS